MSRHFVIAFLVATLSGATAASGAGIDVRVTDGDGMPVGNAVVALYGAGSASMELLRQLPAEAVIDQRHEMFIPLVSIVRRGGHVVFTNHDTTIHQVYSFSPIRQFEFEIDEGQRSEPIAFEKPGVASVGCNIHDHMITYVYVADSPWTVLTGADGRAAIDDVPAGTYEARVWHPQLAPGAQPPHFGAVVGASRTSLALTISIMSARMPGMKRKHQESY